MYPRPNPWLGFSVQSFRTDCATGALQLELSQLADFPADLPPRLRSDHHARLPPQAATYAVLFCSRDMPDSDYLVSPIVDVLMARDVALAHTIVSVVDNTVVIPLLNASLLTQVILQDMSLATISSLDNCMIAALDADVSSPCRDASSTLPPDAIAKMIAPDLTPAQATDLHHLLVSCCDIFYFDERPPGQTSVVTHRINTGDATLIRQRPYQVSH